MNTNETVPFSLIDEAPQSTPLTVLCLHEDVATKAVAEAVYQRLVEELGTEFEFDCQWCDLAGLINRETARTATLSATEADLILFATRANTRPSPALKRWIETWQESKAQQDCALISLIAEDTNQKRTPPFRIFLQDVAAKSHMDFLPHIIRLPANDDGLEAESTASSRRSIRPVSAGSFGA